MTVIIYQHPVSTVVHTHPYHNYQQSINKSIGVLVILSKSSIFISRLIQQPAINFFFENIPTSVFFCYFCNL